MSSLPFPTIPTCSMVLFRGLKSQFLLGRIGKPNNQRLQYLDLIAYIEYNNGTVSTSKIHSIFDYLYEQYTDARIAYLKKHKKISEYDSENLNSPYSRISEENINIESFEYHLPFTTLYVDSGLFFIE
jgi:hypothetical protein